MGWEILNCQYKVEYWEWARSDDLRAVIAACAQANALRLEKIVGYVGFVGFLAVKKGVAFGSPKKRCSADLRQNDAEQMRLCR